MASWCERPALAEFFERFEAARRAIGADHVDLAFPGPFAREVVHWLDRVALGPGEIERYAALSRTVARRPDYFPVGVHPRVVHLPGDLDPAPRGPSRATASSPPPGSTGAKRLDLVIDAMAHVPGDVALRIAGTGPLLDELEAAAHDPRISFCGFVSDESLTVMYREAIAVPFVPDDEDLGLVALEAFSQGTPVVTCTDSGGPTEFVADGVTGLVVPTPPAAVGPPSPGWSPTAPGPPTSAGPPSGEAAGRITWDERSTTSWARSPGPPALGVDDQPTTTPADAADDNDDPPSGGRAADGAEGGGAGHLPHRRPRPRRPDPGAQPLRRPGRDGRRARRVARGLRATERPPPSSDHGSPRPWSPAPPTHNLDGEV